MIQMKQTLILGVGNIILGDEGVGIHVIQELEKESLPPDVDLLDGGTGGFHLVSRLVEYGRIIMIDATLDSHPPGTVRVIRPRYAADFPPLMSAHEIGLRDMLAVMQLTDDLPEIHLIVVSVKNINDVTMELSPEIAAAIPEVIRVLRGIL
jgi:hydrogenase maturation protease